MNSTLKYVLGTTLAVVSLALIVPAAQTQPPAYHTPGLTIVPTGGYGNVPVVIGPNGMQRVTPDVDPFGFYDFVGTYAPIMNPYNVNIGPDDIPRTPDAIVARKEANNRLYLSWQGEPRAVQSITFALLDKNNKVISQQTITSPPAETRLTRTAKTAAYSVTVQYINGMTTSIISPFDGSTGASPSAASVANQIEIANMSFATPRMTVRRGTKVTWVNDDSVPHTVTDTLKRFDSGVLNPGQSFSHTFSQRGECNYFCRIHPEMKGRVVVR